MRPIRELSPDTATHPKIRRMHEYWLSKCAGRPMPSRADIDPLDLRDCLGNLCLLDVVGEAPRRFRFRVDGSNLASLSGFELTGKFVEDVPDPAYRGFMLALYERVVREKTPVFLAVTADWKGCGIEEISVTLPLSSDGLSVDGILDAVFPMRLEG
ncbi:MAG TPA: PAS domain-containing protein [Dongiaceae bacterium]|nr:PAS domain-containing protein [Dongiaceae bacterium]